MINWTRKVKYVLNDEGSDAGQALLEALRPYTKGFTYTEWLNVLGNIDTSEMGLGDYIRSLEC